MSEYEQAIFFEQKVAPWYLQNEPRFKNELTEIWRFKDWPDCWGPDSGVDLIARHFDNTISAGQVKFFDKKYSVKKSDLDSFFSESGRQIIDSLFLFLNTNNIGVNARRMIENHGKQVTIISRKDLENFEWPDNLEFFNPPKLEPEPEWPSQIRAIEDSRKKLKEVNMVQIYSFCGTGKTRKAVGLIEREFKEFKENSESKENFIAALFEPSRILISQISKKLSKDFSIPHRQIGVCSSQDVFGYDEARLSSSELNMPIVTSDYKKLAELLMQPFDGVTTVLLTYHSHHILKKALDLIDPKLYIKIFDEAHHIAGFGEGKIFRPVLKIKSKYTVSMTATPRIALSSVKTLAKNNGQLVVSMDDELLFGPVAHNFSHKQAVEEGIVLPIEIVGLVVRNREIAKLLKANKIVTIKGSKDIDIRALAEAEAIIRFMRESGTHKYLVFLRTIKASKKFADFLIFVNNLLPKEEQLPDFLVQHISGEMNSSKTESIKNSFKQHKGYAILTNAQYLAEGFDDPSIDGVVFIEPRYSSEQIQQIAGRTCRKDFENPDKKCGYTLISYFVPVEDDLESVLIKSPFDNIRQTIEALSLNDDIISSQIDEASIDYGYTGKIVSGKFKSIKWAFPKDFTDREKEIFEATELVMLNRILEDWMVWYGKLRLHLEDNSNIYPTSRSEHGDVKSLAWWVGLQRKKERLGLLSPERIQLLHSLPDWSTTPVEDRWYNKAYEVLDSILAKGKYPSHASKNEEEKSQSYWIVEQRLSYKNGTLNQEYIDFIEEFFPDWLWNPTKEKSDKKGEQVKEFTILNGYLPSTTSDDPYVQTLGIWVKNRRKAYKQGTLSEADITFCESIPFWVWNPNVTWDEAFSLFLEYVKINGHGKVPSNYKVNGFGLGRWVAKQRNERYIMSDDKRNKLESSVKWVWKIKSRKVTVH